MCLTADLKLFFELSFLQQLIHLYFTATIIIIIIIIISIVIIHIPYVTAVQLVLKTVPVSLTKHFLCTVLPKTFRLYDIC
jgi:hypothetical protein